MKILITGICGFVGSTIARTIRHQHPSWMIVGIDNLIRRGSEINYSELKRLGVHVIHGDIRLQSDVDLIPQCDWVLDAAANPSVLAGADGKTSSRQLMEHNLLSTINILEYCKKYHAGFILLSTSRVYSIQHLTSLPLCAKKNAFQLDETNSVNHTLASVVSSSGLNESFPTTSPISLYGASKLASEALALEYGTTFDFPVWVNRCGVLAGAGQFGRPDQGIFAYWINAHLRKRPLKYIGFEGTGHQVRDCLHPQDLVDLIDKQTINRTAEFTNSNATRIINVSGGADSAMSLKQLTQWCDNRFGPHTVEIDTTPRPFDLPWVVLDSQLAKQIWDWQPATTREQILSEIANHAQLNANWLDIST